MKINKKYLWLSLVFLTAFIFTIGYATMGMAESGSQKVGFVDMGKIMKESKAAKSALASLQKEIEAKRAIIKEKNDKIAGMDKEVKSLKQDSSAWKEKRDKLAKEVEDFNKTRVDYDGQLMKKNNELTQKIITEVQQVIKKVAASEKLTIILDKRSALLADDSLDITDKVIKMYDAQKK